MAKRTVGNLPPRYSFILNPYRDIRLSKCPKCDRPTHLRKFALLIHVDDWGPLVLGKTCRYCTPCELIVAHQDELEAQLAHSLSSIAPKAVTMLALAKSPAWWPPMPSATAQKPRSGSSSKASSLRCRTSPIWVRACETKRNPSITALNKPLSALQGGEGGAQRAALGG